ncbi:hypothetical protein MCOR25_009914 [Pyricularia grisea]|nr:hypothetical protein MCOR25_009914 [Pyricularia grisea]
MAVALNDGSATEQPTRPSTAGSHHSTSTDGESNAFSLDAETYTAGLPWRSPPSTTRGLSIYITGESAASALQQVLVDFASPGPEESMIGPASPRLEEMCDSPSDTHFPPLPAPPSARVMQGTAEHDEAKDELRRLLSSFKEHLNMTKEVFEGAQTSGDRDSSH